MVFPVKVPILTLEIQAVIVSDAEPTTEEGCQVILLKDLGYSKLWQIYKVTAN